VSVYLFFAEWSDSPEGPSYLSYVFQFAWQITKERLHRMFAEDLNGYDVRHYDELVFITRSPEEGWRPVYQDHHVSLKTAMLTRTNSD
jgi:hypothetical protein